MNTRAKLLDTCKFHSSGKEKNDKQQCQYIMAMKRRIKQAKKFEYGKW
jgi:hypothetical protein